MTGLRALPLTLLTIRRPRGIAAPVLLVLVLLCSNITIASALSIYSGDGHVTCAIGPGCPAPVVLIVPDDVWQQNNPNDSAAVWISYARTGLGPQSFIPPSTDSSTPTAVFTEVIPTGFTRLSLDVWADDTATVRLNGTTLIAGNFTIGGYCAAGAIGCVPTNGAHLVNIPLTGVPEVLEFDVFQLWGGAFGLLYAGDLSGELAATPEPSSALFLGSSFAAMVGTWWRCRKRLRPGCIQCSPHTDSHTTAEAPASLPRPEPAVQAGSAPSAATSSGSRRVKSRPFRLTSRVTRRSL